MARITIPNDEDEREDSIPEVVLHSIRNGIALRHIQTQFRERLQSSGHSTTSTTADNTRRLTLKDGGQRWNTTTRRDCEGCLSSATVTDDFDEIRVQLGGVFLMTEFKRVYRHVAKCKSDRFNQWHQSLTACVLTTQNQETVNPLAELARST